jgi:predicted transcriptional regulator
MSLLLELSPELENRLEAVAAASEQTPAQWLLDLAAWELAQREAEDAEDLATLRARRANPDPRPNRTLADLRAHTEAQKLAT